MAKEVKQWITVKGRHIPIFEGETVKDAVKRMSDKGKKNRPVTEEHVKKEGKKWTEADKKWRDKDTDYEVKSIHEGLTDKEREEREKADKQHESDYRKWTKIRDDSKHIKSTTFKKKPTQADKEKYIKEHGLDKYVRELNSNSTERGAKAAIDYVYDQHTLTSEQFKAKYFKDSGNDKKPAKLVKATPEVQKAAEQEAQKTKDAYVKENGITGAKGANQLREKINNTGWKIDSADMRSIERGNLNTDDKVTLWDTNGKEYEATYNRYRDGGIELVSVTPKKKEDFVVDYDIQKALDKKEAKRAKARETYAKKKQANMEAAKRALQAGEDTPKTQAEARALKEKYGKKTKKEEASKNPTYTSRAPEYYEWEAQRGHFSEADEAGNASLSNSQKQLLRVKAKKAAGKRAIKEVKEAMKLYGPKRDMIQDVKKYDEAWRKVEIQFARGEIGAEDYNTIYHMFGPRFHEGYKVRHRKK